MNDFEERFGGIGRLYGADGLARFQAARVCVIGLGGVGSWTVESLVRSGIGTIGLVDLDDICVTNINRQIHATSETIGQSKGVTLEKRASAINPQITVERIDSFYTTTTAESILNRHWDVVVDAIDSVSQKTHLIATCKSMNLPLVTIGGAGGRIDPMKIKRDDLSKTTGDRLLMLVRKQLRQKYHFPRNLKTKFGITSIFSDELTRFPWADGSVCEMKEEGTPGGINCDSGLGAITHVTATMGLIAAGVVLDQIIKSPLSPKHHE